MCVQDVKGDVDAPTQVPAGPTIPLDLEWTQSERTQQAGVSATDCNVDRIENGKDIPRGEKGAQIDSDSNQSDIYDRFSTRRKGVIVAVVACAALLAR
jgi:hypothetical protein